MKREKELIQNVLSDLSKMQNFRYTLLLLLVFCISCNRDTIKRDFISEFPENYTPNKEIISNLDTLPVLYNLASADKWLISAEMKRDYIFTLYDENFNKVCNFAYLGRGMNEYIAPTFLGQYNIEDGKIIKFIIYDCALNKLDEVIINVENKEVIDISTLLDIKAGMPLKSIFISQNGGYFGVSDYFNCKTYSAGKNFSDIRTFNPSIDIADRMEMHPYAQSYSCVDIQGEKMAVAYFNFPIIDIRSSDGILLKSILLKKKYIKPHQINDNNAHDYFIKILNYNNRIYALFLEESHNPFKIKSLCEMSENEVMSWQQF